MEGSKVTVMNDIFAQASCQFDSIADFKVQHMILFPSAWGNVKLSVDLSWHIVRFDAESVKDVPDDQRGIYSFVVQPGIADHPACSYLLYVGQTVRNFRVRYEEYLRVEAEGI